MTKPVMFYLIESRKEQLQSFARSRGRSISELMRCAIEEYLDRHTQPRSQVEKPQEQDEHRASL